MNFLAHLHLADISNTSLAANLAGDFAKGAIDGHPQSLRQGIWLHRQIDKITDEHELSRELLAKFPKGLTRGAGILMDLAFDHMLARYWDEYHHQPLAEFSQRAYASLKASADLPESLRAVLPRMEQEDWLMAYAGRQGLNQAISGVRKRLSRPELLDNAEKVVEKMDVEIEIAFRTLYPQLMAYSRRLARTTPAEFL
ncbi:DUF479 domain-containing protein [Shewanella cyperi]|uniref:DUF479 domain-containing protein n=1 Tax=Shewanella cyperi TaxID=2814292 RepID=A0A974XI70_9GAMM|nr:ACP phosphodiesterase [Shewanella cyperi]QSX28865.1 DUF479 domain-containing protein [Shewanella cyperi]